MQHSSHLKFLTPVQQMDGEWKPKLISNKMPKNNIIIILDLHEMDLNLIHRQIILWPWQMNRARALVLFSILQPLAYNDSLIIHSDQNSNPKKTLFYDQCHQRRKKASQTDLSMSCYHIPRTWNPIIVPLLLIDQLQFISTEKW